MKGATAVQEAVVSESARGVGSVAIEASPGFWRHRGVLLATLDAAVVVGAWMLCYYLRFYLELLSIKHVGLADSLLYLKGGAILAAMWVFFIWRSGGYETGLRGIEAPMLRLQTLVRTGVYSLALMVVVSFMFHIDLSRQVMLMTWVIGCAGLAFARLGFRMADRHLAKRGTALETVIAVGMDRQSLEFAKRLRADRGVIRLVGFLRWHSDERKGKDTFAGIPILGELGELGQVYKAHRFQTLVLSSPERAEVTGWAKTQRVLEVVNFCEEHDIAPYVLPGSFDISVAQKEVGSFSGMPLIRLQDASLHTGYAIVKRMIDVAVSIVVLALGLPLWLAIAIAIKLTSKGPVFFVQTRAGLHGRPFRMYKFRSMVEDAEERLIQLVDNEQLAEPVFKIKNDPRVTRFGRFLRRTSLDEMPQLMNVLKGEMTLVGPRPEELAIVLRYNHWQRRRLKGKPGITGYQQISNRGAPSLSERIKYDLIYLKHQSLLLDLYILAKTIVVVARGSGVTH